MSDVQPKNMLNSAEFLRKIEELAKKNSTDYMDAVVDYCAKNGIEIETAAAMIKKSETMKSRLQQEAENLNLMPKTAKLPGV